MEIYLAFLAVLFIPSFAFHGDKRAAWSMAVFIFFISAVRYDVGFDYEAYFYWAKNGVDDFYAIRLEPLSRGMLEVSFLSGEPQLFFVLSSLVIIGLFSYSFIFYSTAPTLSLLTFFCMPLLFLSSLGLVRQSMAGAVVFFALTVLEKRSILSLVAFMLAGLFHYSAWFMVLLWPFLRRFDRHVSVYWYFAALIFSPLLSWFMNFAVLSYLPFYSSYIQYDFQNGMKLLALYYGVAILVLWLRNMGVSMPNRALNYFMLGVVLFGVFGLINQVVGRIAYFFLPFIALLLPVCMTAFRPLILSRLLIIFLLFGMLILQLEIASTNPIKDPYQPFQIYEGWF